MKKDIPLLRVEDVAIAVIPSPEDDEFWDVYLLNLKEDPIRTVLVNSQGYGEIAGDKVKTTILRHFFEEIPPQTSVLIEPIQRKLFDITNEYWLSFVYQNYMYDKKYVFVRGSMSEDHFTMIPIVGRKGVMIK